MDRGTGKAISTSTPSFSIRYNAEDEEAELCDVQTPLVEAHSDNSSPLSTPVSEKKANVSLLTKSGKRSGSLEEAQGPAAGDKEPWKLFTDLKGRITKRVEEKLEEMKCEKEKKKRREKSLSTHLSVSDSERSEKSEDVLLSAPSDSSPEKSARKVEDSDYGDISGSEATTEDDTALVDSKDSTSNIPVVPSESKGVRERKKQKKGKKVSTADVVEVGEDPLASPCKPDERYYSGPPPRHFKPLVNHRKALTLFVGGVIAAACVGSMMTNASSFMYGCISGAFSCLMAVLWSDHIMSWISHSEPEHSFLHGHYKMENIPFLSDKMIKSHDNKLLESKAYNGWMNEYHFEYNPKTYHISRTESVRVRLVGSHLYLITPKNPIPKRAFWSEPKHECVPVKKRVYDLTNCTVRLLPVGIVKKRMWSRKYPISISLLPNSLLKVTSDLDGKKGKTSTVPDQQIEDLPLAVDETSLQTSPIKVEDPSSSSLKKHVQIASTSTELNVEDSSISEIVKQRITSTDSDQANLSSTSQISRIDEDDDDDDDDDDEDMKSSSFDIVETSLPTNTLYLFARTAREKDLWFRRLIAAASYKSGANPETEDETVQPTAQLLKANRERREAVQKNYMNFMKTVGQIRCVYEDEYGVVRIDYTKDHIRDNYIWLNMLLARVLFDTMRDKDIVNHIKTKVQRKLSVIKMPNFMEPLHLEQLMFDGTVPAIERCHDVKINCDGIWVEIEVSYQGTMTMVVDTKINLIKLKQQGKVIVAHSGAPTIGTGEEKDTKTAYQYSSQEDSGETSNDESGPRGVASNKALYMIDKIASSNIFQQVTDNKLVKKAMVGISNTPISLFVEVKSLVGSVVLNIPPPPSDRIWFGFKPNTKIHLKAKPKLGQRGINMHYLTSLIERKIYREFQKFLVIPNMDDLPIPLLTKEFPY